MESSPYLGFEQLGRNTNFEIALGMPLDQLKFYCVNNEQFRQICMDQEFWRQRLEIRYPDAIQYKPADMSWAQYYNGIENGTLNIKVVRVAYNGRIVGAIVMFPNDTDIGIAQKAVNLLASLGVTFDPATTEMDMMKLATGPNDTYLDVVIKGGNIRGALGLPIPGVRVRPPLPHSVQAPWGQKYPTGLWGNLQVIHVFSEGLYSYEPDYNHPVFRQQ
jgi:hypothetical protein